MNWRCISGTCGRHPRGGRRRRAYARRYGTRARACLPDRDARQPAAAAPGPRGVAAFFQPSQTTVINGQPSSPALPDLIATAHAAAMQGSSTPMVPIRAVFEQAQRLVPDLTPETFLAAVQQADSDGGLYLEAANSQAEIEQAQGFVAASQSGPAIRMMPAPPRVSMSRPRRAPMQMLADFWAALAARPKSLRRGGASARRDMGGILADYARPGEVVMKEMDAKGHQGMERLWTLRLKDENGRPLEAVVARSMSGFVHVDTSAMEALAAPANERRTKARGGDLVYQAALTYAHNNGLRFRPDPAGVSDIAHQRRLGHLLSSALRHGTTRHIEPRHNNPSAQDVDPNLWRSEETLDAFRANIALLAEMESQGVQQAAARRGVPIDRLRYDPETDTHPG